jgi:hypothetical protein
MDEITLKNLIWMKWREINKINQPYSYGMKKVEQGNIFALIDIVEFGKQIEVDEKNYGLCHTIHQYK